MHNLSVGAAVVGAAACAGLVLVIALRPELRQGRCFERRGMCKASRVAGYLWSSLVFTGMISTPYIGPSLISPRRSTARTRGNADLRGRCPELRQRGTASK